MAVIVDNVLDLITAGHLIVILLCVLLLVYVIHLKNFYSETPPGPWGIPIFGYLFMISNQPFKQFAALSKKYGDVFSVNIGTRYVIILNHYEVIKEAFIKDGDVFGGKPKEGVPAELGEFKALFVTEGNLWKEQHRFLASTMKQFGLGRTQMEGYIQEEAELMIDKLIKNANKSTDLKSVVYQAVTNIISFLIFGRRFTNDDKDILDVFNHINDIVSSGSQVSVIEAFPVLQKIIKALPALSVLMSGIKHLYNVSDNEIEKHLKSFDNNNIRDLIDAYIMKQKDLQANGANLNIYDVDYMRANSVNLFLAGIDTTGGTLAWALKLLALNPEAQMKIQQEIDDVIGRERPPSMSDKVKMPFTESTLLEIQRFISFVPLSLYHQTTDETYLRGYRIPKRSFVLANLWSVHFDSRIWENPFNFNPSRFLNKDGKISSLRDFVIPFSIGKRSCLGESLAKMEIFLFIVSFLQKLTFHPTEGDTNLKCIELPFRKLKSCKLIVTPRKNVI